MSVAQGTACRLLLHGTRCRTFYVYDVWLELPHNKTCIWNYNLAHKVGKNITEYRF